MSFDQRGIELVDPESEEQDSLEEFTKKMDNAVGPGAYDFVFDRISKEVDVSDWHKGKVIHTPEPKDSYS